MRITTRLSTAGVGGFLSMPMMPKPGDSYVGKDGYLDENAARKDLANNPGILMSSEDKRDTISFAVELLDRMKIAMEGLMGKDPGVRKAEAGAKKTTAERRFDRGRVAFVRIDIGRLMTGLRVKLSAANPREVVGYTEEAAKIYAQAYADNILAICDSLKAYNTNVTLVEGEGCEGIFAESRKRIDRQMVRDRHRECPEHRRKTQLGLMCAPCVFDCELYKDGRCTFDDPL